MKKYILTSDEDKPQEITVRGRHAQIKFDNGYYTDVYVDDNSQCFISWEHGQGKGEVVLPGGEVYGLPALLAALAHANPQMMGEWQLIEGKAIAESPKQPQQEVEEEDDLTFDEELTYRAANPEAWDDRDAVYYKDGKMVDVRDYADIDEKNGVQK